MAIPTLTFYSTSADLTTLSAIFNGVAMICQQNALIWGFAFAVALWRLMQTSTTAALRSPTGQGAAVLASGPMNTLIPFILAMTLTNPMLQGTVQLESTINGALTEVDHVPLAISVIPVGASILSQDVDKLVSTAYQSVNLQYPTISATANGFLNPLKVLLSARTSMVRLGGIDSEVKTVLSSCLGPDSGVNYANIQNLVMNAGNTGATSAQSIEINGVNPTAIGALLYQASSNTNGMVNDPGLNSTNILSCYDAANQVANDITNALNSVEFTRVVQGAVNGMDQPVPGADYSFNKLATQYNAVATSNTLGGVFAGGTAQSNGEFMNLLFSEMVQSDLNCLRASSDTLTQCQATALQAAEIERNNLQQAAAEVPMLRYAGSFGNYLIALIIGLGPVIIMLMMFAGVDSGKSIKTAAHIMVWPILVVNVGAEIVNGMLYIDVANFLQSVRQGGWISQANTFAAYKQLSLQIGVGSHIMASLPVLMSLIFGLGESSAMTSVATTIAPKSSDTADNVAPVPAVTRPMFENSSIAHATQMPNGQANLAMNGSLEAVSTSTTFGNLSRDASQSLTKAQTQTQSIEAGQQNMRMWAEAAQKHDFSALGVDNSIGEQIVSGWEHRLNGSRNKHSGNSVAGVKANENGANAGGQVAAGLSADTREGPGGSLSGSVSAGGSTSASDRLQASTDAGTNVSYDDSKALTNAIHDTIAANRHSSAGQQAAKDLSHTLQTQESFQQTLSQVNSVTDATANAVHDSSSFVQASSQIKAPELLWQKDANPEFAAFQAINGRQFDEHPTTQKYAQIAANDAASGATDKVIGSPEGQQVVNRHRAAVLMAQDPNASVADRAMATSYLAAEGQAMQHMRYMPGDTTMKNFEVGSPVDRTGVNAPALMGAVQRAAPALPVPAVPPTQRGTGDGAIPAPANSAQRQSQSSGAQPAGGSTVAPAVNQPVAGQSGSGANGAAAYGSPAAQLTAGQGAAGLAVTPAANPPAAGQAGSVAGAAAATAPAAAQSGQGSGVPVASSSAPAHPHHPAATRQTAMRANQPPTAGQATELRPPPLPRDAGQQNLRAQRPPNLDNWNFKGEMEGKLGNDRNLVEANVDKATAQADAAGLSDKGAGTARRAAANVADNAADLARKPGSPSRTGLILDVPAAEPGPTVKVVNENGGDAPSESRPRFVRR